MACNPSAVSSDNILFESKEVLAKVAVSTTKPSTLHIQNLNQTNATSSAIDTERLARYGLSIFASDCDEVGLGTDEVFVEVCEGCEG